MSLPKILDTKSVIFIFFCFSFFSCNKNSAVDNLNSNNTLVNTVKVQNKVLKESLNNFGTISYKTKNDVTNLVAGNVQAIYVKEGDTIKKNQVICVLRNVQLEIQKEQAESSVKSAKAALTIQENNLKEQKLSVESRLISIEKADLNIQQKELELELQKKELENQEHLNELGGITDSELEKARLSILAAETNISLLKKEREISLLGLRNEDLIQNGIIPAEDENERKIQIIDLNIRSSVSQVESAKAQLEAAQQQLASAEKLIDELTIRAPVPGIVSTKYYEAGEYVKENEKIITIIDTTSVYAILYVQEQDMVNIQEGVFMDITIPSINKSFNTTIDDISPIADPQTGNFAIKSILKNNKGEIKPGMFIKCSLLKGEQKSYPCLPDTVLISNNVNNPKVFCVVNNLAVQKSINIIAHKDGNIWVEAGVNDGDVVINKPSPFLKEGQYVELHK